MKNMKKNSIFYIIVYFIQCSSFVHLTKLRDIVNTVNIKTESKLDDIQASIKGFWENKLIDPDLDITTPEMIKKEGYPAESHVVLSEDGYLLTIHRIPGAENSPTVFLQHGVLGCSFDWVITGKRKALAFILADKGYDVWLGNIRGNTYSRSHVKYNPSNVEFWDFSWHEMAIYDLPAMITFITQMKKDNLTYIGFSMGTTMFYVMASEKPNIACNVKVMFSLAPIAFMSHLKSPLRLIVPFMREVEFIIRFLGKGEFLPQSIFTKFLAKYGCDQTIREEKICANIFFVIAGFDKSQFNYTLLPMLLNHVPAGASTKTLLHYGQEIKSGLFEQYDYGTSGNIKIYNQTTPPSYNLSRIQVPIGLFWGQNDLLASPIDVHKLYRLLPNRIFSYKIQYKMFNHFDFLFANDAPKLIYSKLLSAMETYP